jgi:DNA-binding GntR family transcriptional regulator
VSNRAPIARSSLVDQVTDRLRADILSGVLEPGAKITVSAVQRDLGVSHIPIREALRRLEIQGLVETKPNRGPVVAAVRLEDLHAIYELRRVLEGHLIRKAAARYSDGDLTRIRASLERLLPSDPKATDAFWGVHHDFHWALLEPVLSDWARRILGLLWQSAERYHRLFAFVFGSVPEAHVEHRRLVEAAEARDGEALHAILMAHLDRIERAITDGYLSATSDASVAER